METSPEEYEEMLQGYVAGKGCRTRPAVIPKGKSNLFRDAFLRGLQFKDSYQVNIGKELIG